MSNPPAQTSAHQRSAAQRTASDPGRSAWVAANAGSGKTSVLVDRVVRLLLDGADPSRILCLTFTKAAAANMQNRVFGLLGEWVALADPELSARIEGLTGSPPDPDVMLAARRLFARAVETPGGLKIQTIHAFCERLLHLFPFEARVPARFEMMDDAETGAALRRALSTTIRHALAGGSLADALKAASLASGEDGVREAIRGFVSHMRTRGGEERKFAGNAVRSALGVGHNETVAAADEALLQHGLGAADVAELVAWLRRGKPSDVNRADRMREALKDRNALVYAHVYLTKEDEPAARLATQGIANERPDFHDWMIREQERVIAALQHRKAVIAAERTEAVSELAADVLGRYEHEKQRLGRLDFSDLILKARDLLTSDAARWVIYKLDQGVDHVLVDEAQDTSPEQWDIVKSVSDEFFSGDGARSGNRRTIFAVGDEKQSIFSFQGARPDAFSAARRHFGRRIAAYNESAEIRHLFEPPVPLLTSYRTTGDVLSAVDRIFALPEHHTGLTSDPQPTEHVAVRQGEPGLVELWPSEEKQAGPDEDPMAPVDALPPDSPEKRLAERIARRIRFWIDGGHTLGSNGQVIGAGDIIVLVRNRNAIFVETIKALKRHGVPVAGADRMKLLDQIAVQDLISLGRFCLLPDDDLALAETLRSPLLDCPEARLEQLAAGRGARRLSESLQERADTDQDVASLWRRLESWRDLAAAVDPLRFYSTVLSGGGRARMIGRLGPDAAEAIDVFLYRLRAWQAANPPSLQLFLAALSGDESDVKRDMEEAHGRVRVMTTHASKGLEAPIIFLADTHHKPGRKGPRLFEVIENLPESAVWALRKQDDPPALAEARARWLALEGAEHRRLLYVGLTRARDRLYICGASPGKPDPEHWRSMIDAALSGQPQLRTVPDEAGVGEVMQWRTTPERPAKPSREESDTAAPDARLGWLDVRVRPEPPRRPPLRPSRLAEAADGQPRTETPGRKSSARLRGDLIHLLLQRLPALPPDRRARAGTALATNSGLDEAERDEAVQTALDLMVRPEWASLFSAEARAEVEIAGRISVAGRTENVSGRIDRLLITPDRIVVLDYKTGRPPQNPGNVPVSHLRQMAVYRALASDLYPDRTVEAAILWTAVPAIARLEPAALDEALHALA